MFGPRHIAEVAPGQHLAARRAVRPAMADDRRRYKGIISIPRNLAQDLPIPVAEFMNLFDHQEISLNE
jgi:hypothetical protein